VKRIPVRTEDSTVICVVPPKPQIKNFQTGEVYLDRESGAPMLGLTVTFILEGRAESLEMSVPQPGVPEGLKMGDVVIPTGMSAYLWEKNGKHGVMFSAKALTLAPAPAAVVA
jgi:hypothetical protein